MNFSRKKTYFPCDTTDIYRYTKKNGISKLTDQKRFRFDLYGTLAKWLTLARFSQRYPICFNYFTQIKAIMPLRCNGLLGVEENDKKIARLKYNNMIVSGITRIMIDSIFNF